MSRLVVELMLKTRTRSAPRSGTRTKESVGSTRASWGWGASCREGFGPGFDRVKRNSWRSSTPPEGRMAQEVTAEPPLMLMLVEMFRYLQTELTSEPLLDPSRRCIQLSSRVH